MNFRTTLLLVIPTLFTAVTALQCNTCDESYSEFLGMEFPSEEFQSCSNPVLTNCTSSHTGCFAGSMEISMVVDGFEIKVRSEEFRGCADEFTSCTILASLFSLSETDDTEVDMGQCAIEKCDGDLCNDDQFSVMSAGADGLMASVMMLVFTMAFFA